MRPAAGPLALLLAGCAARAHLAPALEPLAEEGEVWVYLEALPEDAARLSLSVASVALAGGDGTLLPLDLLLPEVAAAKPPRQRLLARGRAPPGAYPALVLGLSRATLAGEEGPSDLLVPEEPVRVDLFLDLPAGRARVVHLALRPGQARDQEFGFGAAFTAAASSVASTVVQLSGWCTSPPDAVVTVFDRRSRRVAAVVPAGRAPHGMAVDVRGARGYLALSGEDQIQVLDLATGEELRRIPLRPGDEPQEVGLTPDGRTLVVVNRGSNGVAFVDPEAGVELERVPAGQEPWALLLDRAGRRAYVLNRRSNDVTVLDVGNRAVAGTVATDAEPLRAALNRDETRLYVVHGRSAHLAAFSLPDLAPAGRIFVGMGAGALAVDPRTDRIFVGRADEDRVEAFDPRSLLPVDAFDVPGPVSRLVLDGVENVLVALVPSRRAVVFVDLVSRRVLSAADVGAEPYAVVVAGGR